MHLLVRPAASLEETVAAEDLGLSPAEAILLSFSDSDLTEAAAGWRDWGPERPSLRLVPLARLRHPMSVDLFREATLPGAKAVIVRLLGGLDYWRYGAEEFARCARAHGIALAMVPGDGRPDPRLAALSTVDPEDLAAVERLLDEGGPDNARRALAFVLGRAEGKGDPAPEPVPEPPFGVHRAPAGPGPHAAIVFYRSFRLAGDTAPIDALAEALAARGLDPVALYVPSLKDPEAAEWLADELAWLAPRVIVNVTAFSARGARAEDEASPLEAAGCTILQVALTGGPKSAWEASWRGLSAADLAMHVILPEIDGRLFAGALSFKEAAPPDPALEFATVRHCPDPAQVVHVADLAAAWAALATRPRADRSVALVLSTYPGRPDQIAHAVGLDGPASAAAIFSRLGFEGFAVGSAPEDGAAIIAALSDPVRRVRWPIEDYRTAFATLPEPLRRAVADAWGPPEADPAFADGALVLPLRTYGSIALALQPERGEARDRKAEYHDPTVPPRHGYVAFYLWLRQVHGVEAIIHLGAHGTLEWLPGKAVALSPEDAPRALLGAVPVIYPFIVNDPGEAAHAKRRLGAVTIGHMTPPLVTAELEGGLAEVERLVDEFAAADGVDPRRRRRIAGELVDAAHRGGVAEACGLRPGMAEAEAISRIDAFLCDVKKLAIRDGLHVFGANGHDGEMDALVAALDGRFVPPGPAGAPSRGRADVLPTGRNLYSADPRAIPTRTAVELAQAAADAIIRRYVEDHGDWPRAIVLDLWGSATMRTGGEELATALHLLGARPTWHDGSFRVSGVEIVPAAALGRPRVDVTLRISGLFRDVFAEQIALFDLAVRRIAALDEPEAANPLAAARRAAEAGRAAGTEGRLDRVFGPAAATYGAGVAARLDAGDWADRAALGQAYLAASSTAYAGDGSAHPDAAFADRVGTADAFVHIQDHAETDILTGLDHAAHEGGFAAAAAALGNRRAALFHAETGDPAAPQVRTLAEAATRVVHGRAASRRWIDGQMRHGFRGAAEMAATLDAAFALAATSGTVTSAGFDRLYEAYLGDPTVAAFLDQANPAARTAMRARFDEALRRGLWTPRRNDLEALRAGGEPAPGSRFDEAAE